ncbi:hypothetical protein HY409_00155, partial [Candidatus Gottesmanbacteria bacterium]|nr:hypothetical protein [Candidatus Gottesmanbacteria bacterium]
PEFSAPDLSSGQGEAVVTETTEVQPPTGTTSVVSEHPVTVSPASPPEAASSTNAPQAPGAARGEAQPANAATPEPAQPPPETATEAQAPTVEATNATVPPHVETAEQTQQINGVLLEINKLLFEIGDANIAFTTLAAKAKGTLPLGAELRRQVLEGVRRELESKGKTLGPLDKNKKTISDAIKKINDIYAPDAPQIEPKDSALVEFLNKNKATLEQALPEKFDANGLITKVEAGDMSFAEALQIIFSEKAEETKAFRRTLAQALTGATGVPQLGYEDVLKTAGQQVTERNVARLKTAFQAVEKVNWMKRGLTFGGIALVLLMALAPMMMEGQGQGGGHG